ncbi:MAG TPA: S1C family serine protease [Usitatibacter sp.]|nr:S1C family serine protease [Usitatibacter sp.]
MASPVLARRAALAAVTAVALAFPPAAAAAMAYSVTDTQAAPASDASYQQLVQAAKAVVGVKVRALPDARSNETLGQERDGSGVLIGKEGTKDTLVLTMGYLVQEADQVQVSDSDQHTVPASIVAVDDATGFALLKPLGPLSPKPIRIGVSAAVGQLDRLMIVSGGEDQAISIATVVSRRPFAGYWEYLLDDAIFTAPPRLDHSGAALINKDGELVGIGSLFVMDALKAGEKLPGNMFVPIDLLKPAIEEMVRTGGRRASHRPWLGVDSLEEDGRVKVMQVSDESPAAKAGLRPGDIILSIDGEPVESLAHFYQVMWKSGSPGVDVRLTVLQGPEVHELVVHSIDRQDFMRRKPAV